MKSKRLLLSLLSACLVATSPTLTPAVYSAPTRFQGDEQVNIDVYRIASPSVVTLQVGRAIGSGSIVSPEGLVLTNEHVVRGARNGRVTVLTAQEKRYVGQVIAVDRRNDLALVRLQTSDRFPAMRLATQTGIQVGQQVYAIGSPYGLSGTLTTGILSRVSPNGDLQTDAALNPGNSGGPLLNSRGELIGINKAILSPNRQGNTGIGFATSAIIARQFIETNRSRNPDAIATTPRPSNSRLGVVLNTNTLIIEGIERGSLAERVGLRRGDRLLAINGRQLYNAQELQAFLSSQPDSAVLTVARNRRVGNIQVRF
jgi:S1-C subfamily serine protease